MATEAQINAVVDGIIVAFGGDVELFEAWLERSKLVTQKLALESEMSNLQAAEDVQNAGYQEARLTLAEQIATKQAEIDALA